MTGGGWSVGRAVDGSVVVVLRGDVDVGIDGELVKIARLVAAEQPADVAVDLSGVDFMASWGVGFLVRVRALATSHDRKVVVHRASPRTARLLNLVGLGGYLPVLDGAPPPVHMSLAEG